MKERKILVRFDDVCPTMDFVQFQKAMEIVQRYSVKPLLGIIPDCRDSDLLIEPLHKEFWRYVKSLQEEGAKLAMHGCTHVHDSVCRGMVNRGCYSEFAGHSFSEQCEKIRKGKEILHCKGIDTDIFFAPFHSYDRNTLKALAANGFHYMSDGKSAKPIYREGLFCIPCRSEGCPKIGKRGYYTAVFHAHEWTRPEKAIGYRKLQELCEMYSEDMVGFDEFCDREAGNYVLESLDEWGYVRFERYIRPVLSKIKHRFVR